MSTSGAARIPVNYGPSSPQLWLSKRAGTRGEERRKGKERRKREVTRMSKGERRRKKRRKVKEIVERETRGGHKEGEEEGKRNKERK